MIAITRKVSPSINQCELTYLERDPINLEIANDQHENYEKALRSLGLKVISLPPAPDLPDSVFVEDIALVLDEIAIITRPGAVSRRKEVADIKNALKPYRELVSIQAPGTLDGGDILAAGDTIYVGVSSRSNQEGIQQLQEFVNPFGYHVEAISVNGCLHLKSAVTLVGESIFLINPEWINKEIFKGYRIIEIDEKEKNAANALLIDQTVIYQPSFPETAEKLADAGLNLKMVDSSELGKAEGALTCCSLIFRS
ncbi:MAG: dimethylarginine dimethylaminohydrolase family protein [Anaerolineales bacterium]